MFLSVVRMPLNTKPDLQANGPRRSVTTQDVCCREMSQRISNNGSLEVEPGPHEVEFLPGERRHDPTHGHLLCKCLTAENAWLVGRQFLRAPTPGQRGTHS